MTPSRPRLVPKPVAALTSGVFAALSRARPARVEGMRGARILHPDGIGFAARVEITGAEHARGSLLSERATHPAIVRLSRATGVTSAVPDVLGVALRLVDSRGPGEHQDLLFASSAQSPLVRHALVPGLGGFFETFFSSLLPYSIGGRVQMLGLEPANGGPSPHDLDELARVATGRCYRICVASFSTPWRAVGEIVIGERLPNPVVEEIRFNPWNTRDDIRPFGPLMGLRDAAYRGSQRGRLPSEGNPAGAGSNGRSRGSRLSRGPARAEG